MRRSARNVPQQALLLISAACGGGGPAGPTSWFEVAIHDVPVGMESWTPQADGSWDRSVRLDYLVGGDRRRAESAERCTGDGEHFACPSGAIALSSAGPERRRAVPAQPLGPPRDVLAALVLPAAVPPRPVARATYEVDGARRVVTAADRLEIPAVHRSRFDTWVARARRSPATDGPEVWAAGGPCVQQARALVGLAREAGYAAEIVTGRVLRDGPVGPGLYPHAWAEVVADGRSWPLDPALGLVPAGAGHVALARGAERPRLELSVVVVEPLPPLDPGEIRD